MNWMYPIFPQDVIFSRHSKVVKAVTFVTQNYPGSPYQQLTRREANRTIRGWCLRYTSYHREDQEKPKPRSCDPLSVGSSKNKIYSAPCVHLHGLINPCHIKLYLILHGKPSLKWNLITVSEIYLLNTPSLGWECVGKEWQGNSQQLLPRKLKEAAGNTMKCKVSNQLCSDGMLRI